MRQDNLGGKKLPFPIIHIIGLPGAGKTTLVKKLSNRLNLSVLRIGEYRSKYPPSPVGEADAWVALYRELSRRNGEIAFLKRLASTRENLFSELPSLWPKW